MLHVIYRGYGGENLKGRPAYYSKLVALASLVRSFEQIPPGKAELIFFNDGPIPADQLQLMERSGEVVGHAKLGQIASLRGAFEMPAVRGWPGDDLVWFSEDDFLYLPNAMQDLLAAAEIYPKAEYFGLYALIGSYLPTGGQFEDKFRVPKQWRDSAETLVRGHPWTRALSTTSTFGCRVRALGEDRKMMSIAMKSGGTYDHTMSLMMQGFLPYSMASLVDGFRQQAGKKSWLRRMGTFGARIGLDAYQAVRRLRRSRHRLLVAPNPALATHLETLYLATGTDWQLVASDTLEWLNSKYKQ